MAYSQDVQFWKLARLPKKAGRGGSTVSAGSSPVSRFPNGSNTRLRPTATGLGLIQAARNGEGFDTDTGQPESAARQHQAITWFDLACRFVDLKWPHVAAKSRTSIADALATVTPVLVTTTRGDAGGGYAPGRLVRLGVSQGEPGRA